MFQILYKKISVKHFNFSPIFFVVIFLLFLFSLFGVKDASAASLYLSPASSKVSVGNIISTKVLVDTSGKSVNNAEGTVQFPSDLLDVISVSKGSSIFSLWVEEPKFSNIAGTVTFNGGLPNPGYVGSNGDVFSITFRAKKPGTASIVFSDGAVRENDGLGTDILSKKNSSSIVIEPSENNVVIPAPAASGTPKAPVVVSSTHPDSKKWYNNSDIDLQWNVPNDVTAVSFVVGKSPSSAPKVTYDPPIGNKKLSALGDGVWYFNIRFKNKNGWGALTNYKIQIDTVAPNPFKIVFPDGENSGSGSIVSFTTTDGLSGINYYEMKVGDGQYTKVLPKADSSNEYVIPNQDPGKYDLLVKAVDYAGNETVQSSEFTIVPIKTPQIKDYPSELTDGETLKVSGLSYPLTNIEMVVEDSSGQQNNQQSMTLDDGSFELIWQKKLSDGQYTFKVRAINTSGAKSEFSRSINFTVKKTPIQGVSSWVLDWLSVIILIIIIVGSISLLGFYFIYRGIKIKKKVDHSFRTFETSVHKAFDMLRDNVREQVQNLEKTRATRDLTKEEERIIKHLQKDLTEAEEFIEQEMLEISNKSSK